MAESWVLNASPVIALGRIGQLDLLAGTDRVVVVPTEVVEEIIAGPRTDPARQAIERGWGVRAEPVVVPTEILEWGLGRGESAVLALARDRSATALLDDRQARACAGSLGVPTLGTLSVIVRARREQRTPSAANLIRALRREGFRMSDDLVAGALRAVGEEWTA